MNKELLFQLYSIHSPSGNEKKMRKFILRYIRENCGNCAVTQDSVGNVFVTKGEAGSYPCLASHIDQVQRNHSKDFEVIEGRDVVFGYSHKSREQQGLGADDKNGIFVCLRCLEECPRLKVFMAVGEEKGCIGSNRADMSFFEDSLYVLEPDCKGGEEVHTNLKEIPCASTEFIEALHLEVNNYTLTDGKGSDIFALTLNGIGVSCANIPAGYHLPHKDEEYTLISELKHSLEYIKQTIFRLTECYPHEYKSETQRIIEKWQ